MNGLKTGIESQQKNASCVREEKTLQMQHFTAAKRGFLFGGLSCRKEHVIYKFKSAYGKSEVSRTIETDIPPDVPVCFTSLLD